MLIQFAVENVLSFRDKAVLSALAAPGVDHDPHHIYRTPGGLELLRVLVLYGANASGKSNVVKALGWVRGLVVDGTAAGQPISVRPFKLDPDACKRPSSAEFEILAASGAHYSYGFVVTRERVEAEWLFRIEGDDEVMLFEREGGEIKFGDAISPEAERRAFIGFVAEGTRPNQLFLHEAFDRNVKELAGAVGWFESSFGVIDEIGSSLHTLSIRHIVKTVLQTDPNVQAQRIFTTHDTNLLDLTLFTADSVWLLEKDRGGASKLYALSEFKSDQLKQLTGKVEQGYLQGRFGAVPFLARRG